MLAVTAAGASADDPLSVLEVGERPRPDVPDGWARVRVRAAALNQHDLWSLRGVGLRADRLPMTLGCDAAGVDDEGREVVVHAVVSDPDWRDDETLDPRRTLLSEPAPGHVRRRGRGAAAQPRAQAGRAVVRAGRLPADGLAHGVPDAPHAVGGGARLDRAGAGRRRRRGHRRDRDRPRRRLPGVGHQPRRGQARPRRRGSAPTRPSRPAPGCPIGSTPSSRPSARRPGSTR
nr:hypothetical protein [Angustibacter aerolatus]